MDLRSFLVVFIVLVYMIDILQKLREAVIYVLAEFVR